MQKEVHCDNCGRYLFTAFGTVILRIKCRCKSINDVKIVSSDHVEDLRAAFPPKPESKPVA